MTSLTSNKDLEFKCGIEVHQQLNTNKLFSPCPCLISEQKLLTHSITRKLRFSKGEHGDSDKAAQFETQTEKIFTYMYDPKTTSLVELDEEPPHIVNKDALTIGLQLAQMTNCEIPQKILFMRKLIINGSTTSGFQRTGIIGLQGKFTLENGKEVGLNSISLEEDAARIIEQKETSATFALDRLGIPLLELTTDPSLTTIDEVKKAAIHIGSLLRSFDKTKRGIGTIRQDLNISTPKGTRIEIKGAQDLDLFEELITTEVKRQNDLIALQEKLTKILNITSTCEEETYNQAKNLLTHHIEHEHDTLKQVSQTTQSKILAKKEVVLIRFPQFEQGILGWEVGKKRFGTEIAGRLKSFGLKGLIHSDEDLNKYELSKEEQAKLNALAKGQFILLALTKQQAKNLNAITQAILERIYEACCGVPKETRQVEKDGSTTFLRPISGSARMYPETDVPATTITENLLTELHKNIPELYHKKIERLENEWHIDEKKIRKLLDQFSEKEVQQLLKHTTAKKLYMVVFDIPKEVIKMHNKEPNELSFEQYNILLQHLTEEKIDKKVIIKAYISCTKTTNIENFLKQFITTVSEEEICSIIKQKLKENEGAPQGVIIKATIDHFKGTVNGKTISHLIKNIT